MVSLTFKQLTAITQHLLEARSSWEWKHCVSVGQIAHQFGCHLNSVNPEMLTKDQCQILHRSGLLHDIGKIQMDKVMSYLPHESVTQVYIDQIHRHPIDGKLFLERFCDEPEIVRLVAGHHCRLPHLSGSGITDYGYPIEYCKEIKMDLMLTVIALADSLDTMALTKRPYQILQPKADALREIRHTAMRGALDKEVTEWFCVWAENCHQSTS